MTPVLSSAVVMLLSAASVSPASVPAKGEQEALISLDAAATVHLSARSQSGTACTVVDRVRGPFAQSGAAGRSNCELDLLLDAGQYKVRLASAERGQGAVALAVQPFEELNATPVRLEPRRLVTAKLRAGQQASYWLSLDARRVPYVRVAGRGAGNVRLWRNGEWLEPVALRHREFSPTPGQPLHEWWLDTALMPGDYLLRVYGMDATTVTGTSTDDTLTVEADFRPGPVERTSRVSLGSSGVTAVELPAEPLGVLLSLDGHPRAPASLEVFGLEAETALTSPLRCSVEPKAQGTDCAVHAWSSKQPGFRHVALVRGPPGTTGTLQWAPSNKDDLARAHQYWSTADVSIALDDLQPGRYLVGTSDLPYDFDAAPLSCELSKYDEHGKFLAVVAASAPRLREGEVLDRSFNYRPGSTSIRFEVASVNRLAEVFRGRKFLIETRGDSKSQCEVYRVDGEKLERLTQSKPAATRCQELLSLGPGAYTVVLSGGLSGIERLVIQEAEAKAPKPVAQKGGCLFPEVALDGPRYVLRLNRAGEIALRSVVVQPLPYDAATPLTVTLDAREALPVPLVAGGSFRVRSGGGASFECRLGTLSVPSAQGECQVPARTAADTLTLENPTDLPLSLTLFKATAQPPAPPLATFRPEPKPLPVLAPGAPRFHDFGLRESHAVAFDVDQPGLYHATTLGLLSTLCRLRTPVVDRVAENSGGGRGRNCLIAAYLQPGRYLFTAETVGPSRGRAGLVLTRQPPQEFASVSADGEAYFRVPADQLVQQRLTVRAAGDYTLATHGQGQSLRCRLDDPQGWPVEPVPSACEGTRKLTPGTSLWTQLPLTVESMRRTTLKAVRPPVVLRGAKPHPLEFFTWYTAELGADGKDDFTFSLEGQTRLDVVLTHGMQGRVYRLEVDKPAKAVELIPPQGSPDGAEGEGDAWHHPSPGEGCEEGECGEAPTPAPQLVAAQVPPPPQGVKLALPAGRYKLVTEHSKGDTGVTYQLHLGTSVLAPGMSRTVPVPSSMEVLVPRDGTLRLRTEGVADVRCRLFDSRQRLVFEGSDNGPDWNCAVAEPLVKGRYLLVIESETQQPGQTTVSLALPASDDQGPLTDGAAVRLTSAVVSFAVPVAERDAVQEVTFTSRGQAPISCALEGPQGQVVSRQSRASSCGFLVRPKLERYRVRLWTTDGAAQVTAASRSKPVVRESGRISAGQAALVALAHGGRFRTSAKAFCLAGAATGALGPCGPEVSLEQGEVVFAAFGPGAEPLPLDEARVATSDGTRVSLSRQPFLQRATAEAPSLFLLAASVRHGERAAPSCAFDGPGTARERRDEQCFAASGVATEATARLWAATDEELTASVQRKVVPLPAAAEALGTGHRALAFKGGAGAYALPAGGRARLELTLPPGAWAVLLNDGGQAVDLCAPAEELRRCVVTGQGGKVVLVAPSGQADVTTVLLDAAPRAVAFTGLHEGVPRVPGTLKLSIAAASAERVAVVEGALRCTLDLSDGARLSGCRGTIPPGLGAELFVEHGVGPLRAFTCAPGGERWARLGLTPQAAPGPPLAPAVATALASATVDRTLTLEKEAAVRVSAESGVCGLLRGGDLLGVDGLGGGCELVRVLSPGTYRLLARPFAGQVVPGTLRWTAEPVAALTEGVGAERWLAAGDVRLFRFTTAGKGRVGLGVQVKSDTLECSVFDESYRPLGDGCQQYLALEKGTYLLTVRNPPRPGAPPLAFKPVLLGLEGERLEVPEDFLKSFFERVGAR